MYKTFIFISKKFAGLTTQSSQKVRLCAFAAQNPKGNATCLTRKRLSLSKRNAMSTMKRFVKQPTLRKL